MNGSNVLAYLSQIAVIVLSCAALPWLLRLRSATLQHVFWRTVLAACLLLPFVEPRRPTDTVFVAAPVQPSAVVMSAAAANPPSSGAGHFDWMFAAGAIAAAGTTARFVWMGIGLARLRRLRGRAAEHAHEFEDLRSTIGVTAPLLWSADATHPVTFGVFRPVVLLPAALKSVDLPARRAVVAHELHHVKRRDWLWTMAEEVVRAIFWFHPAMWWLISRVQLAREAVVDELSILTTNARRAYLDALLAFADDSGVDPSPAFSARRHLFHRVTLLSKEGGMSSIRIAATSCALLIALASGTWGAVSAFPLRVPIGAAAALQASQPQKPPRDPLTPAQHHRLAQEYWEKANKDLSLTPEEKLDVVLKGIAAEDRALAIDPDYAPAVMYKSLLVRIQARLTADAGVQSKLMTQADELRDKAQALTGTAAKASPSRGVPPAARESELQFMPGSFQLRMEELKPLRIGGAIKAPVKIKDAKPVYPPIARESHVQGVVIIEAIIDEAGRVADARILRSIPLLDQAALEAVQQWEFQPVHVNGAPQPVVITLTVNFYLQ